MAKGNIAIGIVALLAASITLAQPVRAEDGCATLQSLVQQSVYRAATEYDATLPRSKASLRAGVLAYRQACSRTVEVTTGAFTRAMADLGLSIGWFPPLPHPGDYCWSGDLTQCYPDRPAGGPGIPPNQLAFVHDAWKGVQSAVISHMRQGPSSGVSTFTRESLEASLWSSLQLTVAGPLHLGYPRD